MKLLSVALPLGGFADMFGTGGTEIDDEEQEDMPIFEKHDKMLHGRDKGCVYNVMWYDGPIIN